MCDQDHGNDQALVGALDRVFARARGLVSAGFFDLTGRARDLSTILKEPATSPTALEAPATSTSA